MDNTIIQQGMFTSTGSSVTVNLRSDVDWMMVYNTTEAAASQTTTCRSALAAGRQRFSITRDSSTSSGSL